MIFLGVLEQDFQDLAGFKVLYRFTQRNDTLQFTTYGVFNFQVTLQHCRHILADLQGVALGQVRRALEKQDALDEHRGMFGLFLHLVMDTFIEFIEPPVLIHFGMGEVLVACGEFVA